MAWAWLAILGLLALQAAGSLLAWRISRREPRTVTPAQLRRRGRLAFLASAGIGVACFVLGLVLFVRTGHNWAVLLVLWSLGLLRLGLLASASRARRRRRERARSDR